MLMLEREKYKRRNSTCWPMLFYRDFRIVKIVFFIIDDDDVAGLLVDFGRNVDDVLFAVFVADVEVIAFIVLQKEKF